MGYKYIFFALNKKRQIIAELGPSDATEDKQDSTNSAVLWFSWQSYTPQRPLSLQQSRIE